MSQEAQVIELLTDTNGSFIHSEALTATGSAIVPGDLVEITAAGEVQEHSTAAGAAQKAFALTNLPTAGTIDDAYAEGVTARYGIGHSGQVVFARVANGTAAIAQGEAVESAGDGTVQGVSGANIVGYANEAVDNAGGSEPVRISITLA